MLLDCLARLPVDFCLCHAVSRLRASESLKGLVDSPFKAGGVVLHPCGTYVGLQLGWWELRLRRACAAQATLVARRLTIGSVKF
eukprot:1039968-Alexandrium_andersonii.AAC.1